MQQPAPAFDDVPYEQVPYEDIPYEQVPYEDLMPPSHYAPPESSNPGAEQSPDDIAALLQAGFGGEITFEELDD